MTPADFRNATWREVREHVTADMLRVHKAWLVHGPGTTKQVAKRSGISLLTLRPRTTDLYQVGLVECVAKDGTSGVYEYLSEEAAEASGAWKEDRAPRKTRGKKNERAVPSIDKVTPSQLRWAAQIMARAAMNRRKLSPASNQPELFPDTPGRAA